MKKILVMLCVLSAVSTANAGLYFKIKDIAWPPMPDSQLQMNVGDVLTVQILGEYPVPQIASPYLGIFGDAVSIDGHSMIYNGSLSSYLDPEDAITVFGCDFVDDLLEDFRNQGLEGLTDFSAITLADAKIPQAPLTGLLVDDIMLTADKRGYSSIVLFDESFNIISNPMPGGINVVPEPMTVVMLGLGSLFLRRRK